MPQQTEFYASHQYRSAFYGDRVHQRDVYFGFEFPLVVFYPFVHLVHIILIAGTVLAVICTVEQGVGRCQLCRQREFGTLARIDRIVDRTARQGEVYAQVVTLTVGNGEVLPVAQNITLVGQFCRKLEVVIRPFQTLTEHYSQSPHLDGLVGVVIVFIIVIVAIVVHTITVHAAIVAVVITVHVRIVIVTAADIRLAGVECRYGERIRTFAAEPRIVERYAV